MTAKTTRDRVLQLRAEGLTYREIAARLDCNLSYAKRCGAPNAYTNALRTSRDRKRGVEGTCEDCGAPTRYNGHGPAASRRCVDCAAKKKGLAARGTGAVTTKALTFLAEPATYGELREHLGVSDGYVSALLYQRLLPYGLVRRVKRGVYMVVA